MSNHFDIDMGYDLSTKYDYAIDLANDVSLADDLQFVFQSNTGLHLTFDDAHLPGPSSGFGTKFSDYFPRNVEHHGDCDGHHESLPDSGSRGPDEGRVLEQLDEWLQQQQTTVDVTQEGGASCVPPAATIISRQSLPPEPPTTSNNLPTQAPSATGPVRRRRASRGTIRYTPIGARRLPPQTKKERDEGVQVPKNTLMGPFVWDDVVHHYMPADLFWAYLKDASLVPKPLKARAGGCKWPGCEHKDNMTMTVESLQKHVECVHLGFRRFCDAEKCEFSCRSDMFNTRHKKCEYTTTPTIESTEGILG